MSQHPNARLTPRGRETLVSRIESGVGVADAARQMSVSRQTASKRLVRARRGEPMSDRSSRPARLARLTPPEAEARVLEARSYAELLPDERKGTACAFMSRCLGFFRSLGVAVERVMTDNGPAYRSGEFDALLESEGVRHKYTRPYSPWQNGKVERMNRTLAQEWQYAAAYGGEAERAEALPAFMERYNWDRPHSACGGLPPMSRIVGVNNLLARNN